MIFDGTVAWYFLPTVADLAAPTVAEIAAGDLLTNYTNFTTNATENTVDTSVVSSTYDTTDLGTSSVGPFEFTFQHEGNDAMKTLLVFRSEGVLLKALDGGVAAADKVKTYPVRVGRQRDASYARNTEQTFMVTFYVYDEPNEDATVVAA